MSTVENRRTEPDTPPEKLSEEALSQKLGGYQRTELLSMLFTILGVIAGIVLLFLHRLVPAAVLIFAAIILAVFVGGGAQKKKKALIRQQLGGFFDAELARAFGPEGHTPELAVDLAWLKDSRLVDRTWEECELEEFHEGVHGGVRFSAVNAVLRHTVEEKAGPEHDNWTTRSVEMFRGVILRCVTDAPRAADLAMNERREDHPRGDLCDPAAFSARFTVYTAVGQDANDLVTPALCATLKALESAVPGRVDGLLLRDGVLSLAVHTDYIFAGLPPRLDVRDIAAIRSCYTASLRHMGDLLDVLRQDTELFHAAGNG